MNVRHRSSSLFAVLAILLGGCTIPLRGPAGLVASDLAAPVGASADACSGIPHPSQTAHSLFGLVAWGDASIESARTSFTNGSSLSRLATIDYRYRNTLGVATFQTVVCGFFVRNMLRDDAVQVAVNVARDGPSPRTATARPAPPRRTDSR